VKGLKEIKKMINSYYNPVKSAIGQGAIQKLKDVTQGKAVFLVCFPEAASLGLLSKIQGLLGNQLVGILDQISPNPDVSSLQTQYDRFWETYGNKVDFILAVGGGSVIDTAKALMVATPQRKFSQLVSYLSDGKDFPVDHFKPLIAVPTTAGTGSEVTPWATIWDQEAGKKYSLHLDETWPSWAIIDPELMLTLPRSVTLQSGLDALSHALEAIWNRNSNPISDVFAISAAKDILECLPRLLESLDNVDHRLVIARAALKAGYAFSNTKTALAHSISYEMTLKYGLPHGIACSFTLPFVMQKAIGVDAERDHVLAQIFPISLTDAPAYLDRFLRNIGVETDFSAYGLAATEALEMVRQALDGVRGRNFVGALSS